jgi:hypothetical protein
MLSNRISNHPEPSYGLGVRVPVALHWAFHVLGMAAPMLLVIYAFGVTADSAQRAHIIVSGCETLTSALIGVTALAAFYRLGVAAGMRARRHHSAAIGQPVAG